MSAIYSPKFFRIAVVVGALALAACVLALMAAQKPADAAFPGENGRIAFVASPFGAGPLEIYTMLPDGSDRRQLTSGTGDAFSPAWSADGTKIAFSSARQAFNEIFTMNADGSGLKQITPTDQIPGSNPAWSPDGTKIAFVSSGIHVIDADGSDMKRLTNNGTDGSPDWSPDGTKIAFDRQNGARGTSDIWVTNASDGTGQVNLTPDSSGSGFDFYPDWSPDGTKITFSGDIGLPPNSEIYTVNASGSSRTALTNTPTVAEYVSAWSPDGTEILFEAYDMELTSMTGIWKMRVDGTNRINLTGDSHAGMADWQPLPHPTVPKTKADCKKGGYKEFGFKNQGQCIASLHKETKSD